MRARPQLQSDTAPAVAARPVLTANDARRQRGNRPQAASTSRRAARSASSPISRTSIAAAARHQLPGRAVSAGHASPKRHDRRLRVAQPEATSGTWPPCGRLSCCPSSAARRTRAEAVGCPLIVHGVGSEPARADDPALPLDEKPERGRLPVPAVRRDEWPVRVGHPGGRVPPPVADATPATDHRRSGVLVPDPIPSAPAQSPRSPTMSAHGIVVPRRRSAPSRPSRRQSSISQLAERRVAQVELGHVAAVEAHAVELGAERVRLAQQAVLERHAREARAGERREVEPAAADRDVGERRVGEGDAGHAAAGDRDGAQVRAAGLDVREVAARRSARRRARAPRASSRRATRRSAGPRGSSRRTHAARRAAPPPARDRRTSPRRRGARGPPRRTSASEQLVLAAEDLADRVVGEDPADRVGQQVGAARARGCCPARRRAAGSCR